MEIVDAQIHVWEDDPPPSRSWEADRLTSTNMPVAVTVEAAVTAMDAVGVDTAVLSVPPTYRKLISNTFHRYDNSYGEEAATNYPQRFCSVMRIDPRDPELEEQMALGMRGPGVVGLRIAVTAPDQMELLRSGGYERLFAAAEEQAAPIMLLVQPDLDTVPAIARAHPELALILDHVGLVQPNMHRPPEPDPLGRLADVTKLGSFPNVYVKLTGIVTLSSEGFPFADLHEPMRRLIDAFGAARLLWGSDYTRTRKAGRTYAESVEFLKYAIDVSEQDRAQMFGASTRSVLRWPAQST
jgi:L-fuconolactonase